jgi:hypothetical protein
MVDKSAHTSAPLPLFVAVFVAQLFAISDSAASLWLIDCAAWKAVGIVWLACGPFCFLVMSTYRVHMVLKKSKTLLFTDSPKHTMKKMRATIKGLPDWKSMLPQCYIFYMDFRFVGGWAKKDDLAKFWGWTMAAYSDRFFLILTWILAKKMFSALNKNWLDGKYNAATHVVIYSIDLLLYAVARPFRDRTVNLSQVVGSCTNLCSILIAALPILIPDLVPDWLNSSLLMAVSTLGTFFMVAQALLDPIFLFTGTFFTISGQVSVCITSGLMSVSFQSEMCVCERERGKESLCERD